MKNPITYVMDLIVQSIVRIDDNLFHDLLDEEDVL